MVDGELKIPPTIEVCATGSYILLNEEMLIKVIQ
jgi:hypothetical protein